MPEGGTGADVVIPTGRVSDGSIPVGRRRARSGLAVLVGVLVLVVVDAVLLCVAVAVAMLAAAVVCVLWLMWVVAAATVVAAVAAAMVVVVFVNEDRYREGASVGSIGVVWSSGALRKRARRRKETERSMMRVI